MTVHNTSSLFDITSKVVLITGATVGLGQAAAKGLAQVGANVMLTALSEDKLPSIFAGIVQDVWTPAYTVRRTDAAVNSFPGVVATPQRFRCTYHPLTTPGISHTH